jgi:hypothetical protein
MTHHLTPEELIDALDRPLPPDRQQHTATCAVCRAERARLDEMVREVGAVDVPEPSPLFWDHLSARINERIALEPAPATHTRWTLASLSEAWRVGGWPRWAMAGTALAVCAVLGWLALAARDGASTSPRLDTSVARGVTPAINGGDAPPLDLLDEEWAVMERVAEHVAWDDDADTASIDVKPATVEYALNDLSPEERQALVELLRAEMARPPS